MVSVRRASVYASNKPLARFRRKRPSFYLFVPGTRFADMACAEEVPRAQFDAAKAELHDAAMRLRARHKRHDAAVDEAALLRQALRAAEKRVASRKRKLDAAQAEVEEAQTKVRLRYSQLVQSPDLLDVQRRETGSLLTQVFPEDPEDPDPSVVQ